MTTYGSSWSWTNYSSTAPHDVWPTCSKPPNCVRRSGRGKADHRCLKWSHVINYPVLVGDMDGSGSRGITWLLRAGGVWMR